MMFNKIESNKIKAFANSTEENTQFIPVSSLEEVAIHLRDSDEEFNYEYYLVQITQPKKKLSTPPPFTPPGQTAKMSQHISSSIANAAANLISPLADAASISAPAYVAPKMNSALVSSEVSDTSAQAMNADVESAINEPVVSGATFAAAEEAYIPEARKNTPESESSEYLAQNADLLLQVGEIELARNIYRAILKTGDSCDVAYAGLANCSDKEGMIEQAIQFAWDSVAFAPNKKGYQILSQLLVQQGRDQEAAQALSRAIKSLELSAQEKAEYHKMIGNCMARLGQNPEAERAYKKALELSPASDETQSNLGSLYLEQGQVVDAKRCYQDAIASNPTNDKAWVGLGLCFVAEGDKEAAHDAFSRSLERNLRNSTAIFHLVKCAYEIKKYSQAERMLSNYVEVAPVSPSLLYSLAGLQFHVGKKKEAALTAKRILQIKGDHQGARDLIRRIDAE
jgi:tetratricopeptide (TPR) repeat protein